MGIGLGVGINRSNYAQGIFGAYATRVVADGGVVEAGSCVDAVSGLLLSASLLLVPSGYKGGKLYAEIPTNGNGDLTWTRGSDAFRTNANGLIQRVPWNLLQQSETFSNASWTKNATTITADATLAPNGTLTADKLVETATSSTHWVFQSTTYTSTSQTVSCYMKKGERNFGFIRTRTATNDLFAWFNLNTGVVGTVESGITASITNIGDGWYRCVVVNPNPTTSANPSVIGLSNADNVSTYTGDGTSGIFIWGAQLVEGTTAQTYLPTTDRLNFPRLSYMYGSCPAVLLEPQRTNLITYSNTFSDSSWAKIASSGGSITITDNYNTSPDGNNNASRFVFNNLNTAYISKSFTSVNATSYTISIYAKSNTSNSYTFQLRDGYSGSVSGNLTITPTWQRFTWTFTASGTISEIMFRTSVVASGDISIYGGQSEAGAYPTTYIPTTSATATRVADSFSRNNIYTNGLITASGGTWFVELRNNIVYTRDSSARLGIGDTTDLLTNSIVFSPANSGRYDIAKRISGSSTFLYSTATDTTKIAIKWNGSTADIFANGTKVVSATSFTTTIMENLLNTSIGTPTFIQAMALYSTPLSDSQCQTLTTL
jgi:hypothetical protein